MIGETFLLLVILFVYFMPTIAGRGRGNIEYIFIINLLAGWTVAGWLLAFYMAAKD